MIYALCAISVALSLSIAMGRAEVMLVIAAVVSCLGASYSLIKGYRSGEISAFTKVSFGSAPVYRRMTQPNEYWFNMFAWGTVAAGLVVGIVMFFSRP